MGHRPQAGPQLIENLDEALTIAWSPLEKGCQSTKRFFVIIRFVVVSHMFVAAGESRIHAAGVGSGSLINSPPQGTANMTPHCTWCIVREKSGVQKK